MLNANRSFAPPLPRNDACGRALLSDGDASTCQSARRIALEFLQGGPSGAVCRGSSGRRLWQRANSGHKPILATTCGAEEDGGSLSGPGTARNAMMGPRLGAVCVSRRGALSAAMCGATATAAMRRPRATRAASPAPSSLVPCRRVAQRQSAAITWQRLGVQFLPRLSTIRAAARFVDRIGSVARFEPVPAHSLHQARHFSTAPALQLPAARPTIALQPTHCAFTMIAAFPPTTATGS